MKFEFDNNKSNSNKIKHGINFEEAQYMWLDVRRVKISSKYTEEPRFLLIAKVKESIWTAIYTYRENTIRIISVRKARKNEKEIYFR